MLYPVELMDAYDASDMADGEIRLIVAGEPIRVTPFDLAMLIDQCRSLEEGFHANARLIAAAPDMLAAIKNFMRCANRPGDDSTWIMPMLAAIAKAEGEAM